MTTDYYAEARQIAQTLELDGFPADARALIEAIDSGSTGTEILMALRWHLQRIDESNRVASGQTRRRIRELCSAIKKALAG